MFPEHVERSIWTPNGEYSFDEYFQLGSRRKVGPIKNGLKASGPRPSIPGKRHLQADGAAQITQAENESLKEDVKYLSARCESLQQYCENLYDWQDQLSNATRELDDHLDRLDAFSRNNNYQIFNVHEGPGEDYKSCARKVVQLLNRFFPFKTWRPEDLEQAHRVGP